MVITSYQILHNVINRIQNAHCLVINQSEKYKSDAIFSSSYNRVHSILRIFDN